MRPIKSAAAVSVAGESATDAWLRALAMTAPIARNPARILPVAIAQFAQARADAPALLSDRESLSYGALVERSRRYARWALRRGLTKGDVVCLMMPNRPEYLAIWLGLTQAGCIVSLINTNLVGPSLAHCIDIVRPQHIIVADDLLPAFATARPLLVTHAQVWSHGECDGYPDITRAIEQIDSIAESELPPVTTEDCALYIYTSGTTGMPKAAKVSHHRLMTWSAWFAGMLDVQPHDRMYNCLPLYHSVGGVVATGALLLGGGSVAIAEKFSARRFWDDVVRWDCTLFQYIGELCRYLVQAPKHPDEAKHRLRLACGNGLRPDVWEAFAGRFGIPKILEFYAATEGNVTLFNAEGKPGAIGRTPPFLAHRSPVALVRLDESDVPIRDAQGCCIRCAPNEVGEAIGRISAERANAGSRFEGYASSEDSERKVLRDVFKRGDAWFRTGDLMRKDEAGYFYFVDRTGDTFRWKGENVSTGEVAAAIAAFPGIRDVSVYGVAIPGTDGRAGMAAIVSEPGLDLAALQRHLTEGLPVYARPVFLRLRREIAITATFKHRKHELVREGYDPDATDDPIYMRDPEHGAFVRLDRALYRRIQDGNMRF